MDDLIDCIVEDIAAPIRNALVGGPFGSNLVSNDYVEFGVPVIRGQNMGLGRWVSGEFVYVSNEKALSLSSNIARPGDLIFTQRGTLGQVAIVPEDGYSEYIISQSQMKLTPDASRADIFFLYYYFSSSEQQQYILNNAIQTGVPHTNLTILRNTPLVLPPLPEQRAIAHILGSLDDKIEANRRMNATLEATARALFKSWFVDFDPVHAKARGEQPAGMDAVTAALFPDHFEDSELGPIPAGWEIGTLGDVVVNPRRSVQPEQVPSDTLYVGLEHIPRQSLALTEWGVVEDINSNKYQFEEGEILFGKLRPYFHKVVFAPICGVCSTDILVIAPQDDVFYCFSLLHLSSVPVVEFATRISTGTRMPRTNWDNLSNYPVVLPPRELLEVFNAIALPNVEQIQVNIYQSRTLAETRDALLPRLVSGELRVGEI